MQCPEPIKLQQLLDEALPANEQQSVQAHLENCTQCQAKVEQMAAGGVTWDKTAQSLGAEPPSDETALADAVARLQNVSTDPDQTRADAATAPPDDDLSYLQPSAKPGSIGRLDDYEILSVVGKGGFGIVLKAFDETLHRVVAIKVMLPQMAASAAARQRFTKEARASAAMTHENVVTIHAVSRKDATVPYLVMQFVSGLTLHGKIDKSGPLCVKEILRIGMQIAEGLAAAHKQGLIHRDIKPGNILLENHIERVKITDFGLARAVDDASTTQSGTVAGTPMYMSPEQAGGEPVDHRSDLFSLGSVLYAMCTGRPPFRATSSMAVMKRVCEDTPTPVQQVNADIPDWLCDIITKLHAKKPADRFQSAKEVAELLGQRLADLQAGRTEGRKAPVEAAATESINRPLTGLGSPKSRRKWLLAGAALVVLAVLASVAYVFNPFRERLGTVVLRAEDVLPRLAGTWAIEHEMIKPERTRTTGVVRFEWLPSEKFVRGYTTFNDGSESLAIYAFEPRTNTFKHWGFTSGGGPLSIQGPGEGQWDFKAQTLTLKVPLPFMHGAVFEQHWKDVDHFEMKIDIHDHSGAVVGQHHRKMRRIADQVVEPKLPIHPKRGKESAILDRMVGSWVTNADVTLHELAGKKVQSESTSKDNHILAGRFIEAHARPGQDRNEYFITGYDDNRKVYRFWHFMANGEVIEADGTLEQNTLKLNWKSLDKKLEGYWDYSKSDERHSHFTSRDAQGRKAFDVTAVSRREGAVPPKDGWVQLFNGKDLAGWRPAAAGKSSWKVAGQILVGRGQWDVIIADKTDYTNFHLRARLKVLSGNAGVYFRMPGVDVGSGYVVEAQRKGDLTHVGRLMVLQDGPNLALKDSTTTIDSDSWIDLEIIARGDQIKIAINGQTTAVAVDSRYSKGRIGLRTWQGSDNEVYIQKIEIKELPHEEHAWVQLFNGKNLTGWKGPEFGKWTVENEHLVGKGDQSWLRSVRSDYGDLHLRMEAKYVAGEANLVLRYRAPLGGYAIYLKNKDVNLNTGALKTTKDDKEHFGYVRQERTTPDEWFLLDVIMRGNHVQTFVNGERMLDFLDPFEKNYSTGAISFGIWGGKDAELHVRKLEVKELLPEPMRAVAPFSAEQAKAHQGAWSADLGVEVEIKNSVGMKLRLIPPGTFNMGSTKAEVDEVLQRTQKWNIDNVQSELPQRSVRIPRPFYIGIHELTVGQFRAFVTDAKYETWAERTGKGSRGWDSKAREMVLKPSFTWKSPFVANTENHPVVNLHREDVEAFCRWLSKNEERTYVIPSEQQWEFACRAGTNTSWHWGDNEADASKYTWFGEPATSARQMPVGLRSPNAFGLHDMSGNVAEMTRNEKGDIVMRGGHSGYAPVQLRSAAREIENHTDPTYRNGVRLAIDLSHPR